MMNIIDCNGNSIKVGDILVHPFEGAIIKITSIRAGNIKALINDGKSPVNVSQRSLARCQLREAAHATK